MKSLVKCEFPGKLVILCTTLNIHKKIIGFYLTLLHKASKYFITIVKPKTKLIWKI